MFLLKNLMVRSTYEVPLYIFFAFEFSNGRKNMFNKDYYDKTTIHTCVFNINITNYRLRKKSHQLKYSNV